MLKNLLVISVFFFTQAINALAQKPGSLNAIDFDGKDDYINVPDNGALNPSDKVTVEAWIKADAYTSAASNPTGWNNSIFCKHGWASGQKGYTLRCGDNGILNFNIANTTGAWVEAYSGAVMKTGIWYHVVGLFNGDSVSVYINGNLEGTKAYTGTISPSTGMDAKIGNLGYTAGGNRLFDGQIDEVRVWNTALSKATIRDWMCRKVTKSHPNYSNLAVYYKLDESSGTDAADQSTYANKGTLTNGPSWTNSGAALGDSSVYIYGGTTIGLKTKFGDMFTVKNIKGSPSTFHALVNYGTTNQQPSFGVTGIMDSTHYFGVYYADNASVNYDVFYNFKNYSKITSANKCKVNLFSKTTYTSGSWDYASSKFYGDSLEIKKQTNRDFIMAQYEPDTNTILLNPSGINWFCGGDSLILLAADNDSFTYSWYKNGTLLNGKTKKSLWVSSPGTYRAKIIRSGSASCSYLSKGLFIDSRSTNVTWNYSLTTCQNSDSIQLTSGSPSGGYYSGKTVSSAGYFYPKRAGTGKFTLFYNFIDTNNCVSRASNIITLLDTAKLTQTIIKDPCFGSADFTLNNVSPTGGIYQGTGVTGTNFSTKVAGAASHRISYSYTQANTCKSKAWLNIKINKPDSISVKLKDKSCSNGDPILVKIYPAGGVLMGSAVIVQTFYPSFGTKGYNWVYYSITDSHNCPVSDSARIYISEIPKASIKSYSSVCDNTADFKLTNGQPLDSGKYLVKGLITDKFSPASVGKGLHKIEYKVINYFGCRDSANTFIRVNASPVKPTISLLKNTLTSSYASGNQWFDNIGPIAQANQQNFNPAIDGFYKVKFTNDSNCSNISDSFQFIKAGIKFNLMATVTIFPNPSASGIFYILGLNEIAEITIADPMGRELTTLQNIKSGSPINLKNFGSGTYFIRIKNEGQWLNNRVVVL